MNSVLDKLFNLPYFGAVLFGVIGLLAIIFITLLSMAIADAKKGKVVIKKDVSDDKADEPLTVDDEPTIEINQEEIQELINNDELVLDSVSEEKIDLPEVVETNTDEIKVEIPEEVKEEEKVEEVKETPIDLSDLMDLPTPQPIKVVSETKIIDSSAEKNDINVNNLENEEYNLKR